MAVLLGLHQSLGGPFKLVVLFKAFKCLHVYECVTQGREWWYTLHLTTDTRYTLREMQPSFGNRREPFPKWWQHGAGSAYPRGVINCVSNDVVGVSTEPNSSVLILRDAADPRNLSGGVETFVPERLLLGTLPQALLDDYLFYQDQATEPPCMQPGEGRPGYKKLRGYAKPGVKNDTVLVVEFQAIGSWEEEMAHPGGSGGGGTPAGLVGASRRLFNVVQATGLPGRSLRVLRRPKQVVEAEFKIFKAVAAELERLQLLKRPMGTPSSGGKGARAAAARGKSKERPAHAVGDIVEFDVDGSGTRWVAAEVLKAHVDGAFFDLEPQEAWVGRQVRCPLVFMRKPGASSAMEGEGVWKFEGLSDSEEEDWRGDDDDDVRGKGNKDDEETQRLKNALPFEFFDRLGHVLRQTGFDETLCVAVLRKLAAVPGAQPFRSVERLAECVAAEARAHFATEVATLAAAKKEADAKAGASLRLLSLLAAPRKSRLHSVARVLSRVENLSHVLAWTDVDVDQDRSLPGNPSDGFEFAAPLLCPALSLIELPRLKLAFSGRVDHEGSLRLYSLDHSDLFITNDRHPAVNAMLAGIPHSLLLANLKGEMAVLVPVLRTVRPSVGSEPFSTMLVLDRSDKPWAAALSSRYYMYPVHVSASFLLTRGLNSALYLLLLRLLHRSYDDCYRLTDSVASDTALSSEGAALCAWRLRTSKEAFFFF